MSVEIEIAAIKKALAAHKQQIENAHAETMAAQSILVGFINALLKRGIDDKAAEEAFEYAAQVAMTTAEKTAAPQATRTLQVVDQLRDAIAAYNSPRSGV